VPAWHWKNATVDDIAPMSYTVASE